jgi:NAD(P)-dependent dehydrogenase (short-subunit alcohol dehydrogenase family)
MANAYDLRSKRVLIVGASSGIGRALGIAAAAGGARVAFAGRRLELLETAVKEAGSEALAVRLDTTVESEVISGVAATIAAFGGLDAVIYATAIDPLVRIADVDGAAWANLMSTNVIGASLVTREALAALREVKGRVIYVSATSVGRPLPGMGAYATSKAALEELARAWRSEYRDVSFCTAAVGMCLGTGVGDNWDPALLRELSAGWGPAGYMLDNGPGVMNVDEVSDALLAILASPTFMPYVGILPDPARATMIG